MNDRMPTQDQALASDAASALEFGDFRIDLDQRVLSRGGARIKIQKKPLAVLIYLIEQAPRMVPREELLEKFWSRVVNEESLTRCVSTIRKLLDDSDDPPRFVETHRAEGYRFVASVSRPPATPGTGAIQVKVRRPLIVVAAIIFVALLIGTFYRSGQSPPHAPVKRVERIAVVPIAVIGPDAQWLRPALADHMMRAISRIEGVSVVTLTADPDQLDIQAHGRLLNVEALLLTRLDNIPAGSRLSARLVSATDNSLLWSTSLDSPHEFSSSQQIQELARRLAVRLRPALQLAQVKPQVDQRAYSYYLQGRYYWSQRSAIGLEAAIAAYDAALQIDAGYTDALIGSAESWLLLPLYGAMAPNEAIPEAKRHAERVLELDPSSSRARAVLGSIAMQYNWDWTAAETLLREAVALNPNDATAQQWLGELFCYRSRFADCARQFRIAIGLDPLSPVLKMQQGSPALYSGDFETALTVYAGAERDFPEYAMGRYAVGLAQVGLGDWERAVAAYRSSLPDLGLAIVGGPLAYALGRSGATEEAQQILEQLEALAETRYVPPSKLAVAHLGLGNRSRALQELWRAVEAHDDRLVYFAHEVHFRNLVAEEGFRDVARHLGF